MEIILFKSKEADDVNEYIFFRMIFQRYKFRSLGAEVESAMPWNDTRNGLNIKTAHKQDLSFSISTFFLAAAIIGLPFTLYSSGQFRQMNIS